MNKLRIVALALVALFFIPFGVDHKPLFEIKEVFRLILKEEWKMWFIMATSTYGVVALVWRD